MSTDGVAALESLAEKLGANVPILSQILSGIIAMESGTISTAVTKLDTQAAADLALVKARLDSLPL